MFASIFTKSLRDHRRSLAGWSAGVAVLFALMAALWPTVRDMPELETFLANYPEALKELFNFESITTGAGFLNAELYSVILPAMFIIFAISRGVRLLAAEEDAGTLDALLVTPLTRVRVLLEKIAAFLVLIAGLGIALAASTMVAGGIGGMDVSFEDAAIGALAMTLLGAEHGMLALGVAAATGRRSLAVGVPAITAGAGYLLYILGELVSAVGPWAVASPFHQALANGPLGGGPISGGFAWMALGTLAFALAPMPIFERRDIAAA